MIKNVTSGVWDESELRDKMDRYSDGISNLGVRCV